MNLKGRFFVSSFKISIIQKKGTELLEKMNHSQQY